MIYVYLNFVFSGALWWTCFCRVVRTDTQTHLAVRAAFCLLAAVAAASAIAPFGVLSPLLPSDTPGVMQLILLAAMVTVQGLTARFWRDGVPSHFQCELLADPNEVHP